MTQKIESPIRDFRSSEIEILRERQRVMWTLLNESLSALKTVSDKSDLRTRIIDTLAVAQIESNALGLTFLKVQAK